jgi:hypothetical protein
MKLIADARGRLTSAELVRSGKAFDATPMPDGSVRIMELAEKTVPTVKVQINRDGTISCCQRPSRAAILADLRADREAQ